MSPGYFKTAAAVGLSAEAPSRHKRAAGRLFAAAIWPACLVVIIAGLAVAGGAFQAEFGAYPDEPAHVVNGLFVRDYILHGIGTAPLPFAESYYLHYPKLSLGIWGPAMPALMGAWTLVFSDSAVSILLMMVAICTALAIALYRFALPLTGRLPAMAASLLFPVLPIVQSTTH